MNDQKPYEQGSLVRLNSGGPIMTVYTDIDEKDKYSGAKLPGVRCTWFDTLGCVHSYDFERTMLEPAPAPTLLPPMPISSPISSMDVETLKSAFESIREGQKLLDSLKDPSDLPDFPSEKKKH